jgi:signal transduction histidine kinase/CheY-like chemotaxis protein/HPt (histidine-containing phosphotransfer) domain-containing protein
VLGLLTVAPFLLSWTDPGLWRGRPARTALETVALVGLVIAASLLIFGQDRLPFLTLTSLIFPFLLLATFRTGLPGATAAVVALACVAVWFTGHGHGPMADILGTDVAGRIHLLQLYLAVVVLSTLPVAIVLAQRETLASRLRETREEADVAQRETDASRAQAEEARRAKTDFLAAMSHEIRTPLTGVLGMAELLAAEPLGDKQRDYVEAIRSSGKHLLAVVNDVLDFSQIEAGGLELERVDFPLAEPIEQVRFLTAPQATERGLGLRFELDEGLPPVVRGDPTRLRQVLLNLVGNALKFTHKGVVVVTVSGRAEGEGHVRLCFEVLDTGIGIPEEKRAELFDAFTQVDRSTSRRYVGSGLGLAICKRLVEAMGGTIGVESAPGEGSLFWFEIPLEIGSEPSVEGRAASDQAEVRPLRLLVAEDVELTRELLGEMLGQHGHEVVFAANGAEAVERAAKGGLDLVLMDVQMPVMDGVEATRRIRRLPAPAGRVPIVALTANVAASEREQYLAAGMDDCLAKPIDWGLLFAALARHGRAARAAPGLWGPPEPKPGASEEPLIDRVQLKAKGEGVPAQAWAGFLEWVLKDAERACGRLEALPVGSEELVREAHSLKGTTGSFGLRRISSIAAAIEAVARNKGDVSGLVGRLATAVVATRVELSGAGVGQETEVRAEGSGFEREMEEALEVIREAVLQLLREDGVHSQLTLLAVARVAGELGASKAIADGQNHEALLRELADVVQQAGGQYYKALRLLELPAAGRA